ncbi:nematode cuticle collagen domain protein [Ancylostoma caninum]|uniref:Nematode cuticle collagen domain protein n=1 Tax=Ancylostoma caninum TaxID=29170 RepID=A0A368FYG4_ANCCA|nr:nematode cuticle collagen domain protein [Ancylostoma caninum]
MSVSKATAGALCLSTFTLLVSLYAIYNIYTDVRGIWMQLDEQMVEFKVQTDDIWTQMLGLGAATPSTRQRRQGKDQYGAYEAQGVNAGPVCGKSLPSSPLTRYQGFIVTVVNSSFG